MQRLGGGRLVLLACLVGSAVVAGCQREQQLPKSIPVEQQNAGPSPTLLAQFPAASVVEQIERQLAADPLLHGARIVVDHGSEGLRLRGFVKSGAQAARAVTLAQAISGNEQVDARLIRRGRSGVDDGPLPAQPFLL